MRHHASVLPGCALALACVGLLPRTTAAQDRVDFNRDIRPILADKCFPCHGPDAGNRKGDLRLDVRAVAFGTRGDRGPAIVPGDPDASELVRRITHVDPAERMPARRSGKTLEADDKRLLIEWIRQGANWDEHWAFVAPRTPAMPTLEDTNWAHNEIDHLVLARLEANQLRPSPAADRRTLIRRVSLEIVGLPPSPEEVAAFVADRSPNAYEKVVDRLFASPHYGEHMARFWLDAARYGDTHGLHLDNYREMWLYRDWVTKAFRDNMPFDRFTLEQIAGDMLPDATREQKIASGFNRCHVTTNEGGSIKEEVYVRNVIDRVSTTGTVFLGLSLGCAVCHDHKFDPITQREFYQMFAFFNNLDGKAMDGNGKAPAPVVRVPSADQSARIATLRGQRVGIEAKIVAALAKVEYTEPTDQASRDAGPRETTVWVDDALPEGAVAEGDGLVWATAPSEPVHTGRVAMKRVSKGTQQHFFSNATRKLRVGAGDVLFAWVYLEPNDPPRAIMLQWNADGKDDWGHRAYWGENVIEFGKDRTAARRRLGKLPAPGKWVKLEVPVARVGLRPGMVVHGMAFTQHGGTAFWDTAGIESTTPQVPEDYVWIDDVSPKGAKLGGNGRTWQWRKGQRKRRRRPPVLSGARSLRRSGKGLIQDYFTGASVQLRLQAGDRLFAHVWLDPKDPPQSVQLQFHDGSWEHRARWGAAAHGPGRKGGADFVAGPLPKAGGWVRLEVPIEKVGLAPGRKLNGWAFTQVDGTVFWDKAGVRTWGPPDHRHRVSKRAWEQLARNDKTVPGPVRRAIAIAVKKRNKAQEKLARDHFLRHVYTGTRKLFDPLHAETSAIDKKIRAIEKKIPTTLIMKERVEPRQAYQLRRGQYDQRGEKVGRATPAALPPMSSSLPRNRLGLARWLIDPTHPLTARVTVNRFWQQVFGVGLVKTSEDFGNQGERPKNPELLDWLARRFVEDGWDVKRFMKRIVMSKTYRQSSHVTPELLRRDPDNRLLARGPRFRLDAETLRDQALAISGLLVRRIGGPAVKPPQPAGLWKAVGYSGSNTVRFRQDKGADKLYRRSLYTFWKRTSPPPQMSTFDAPSREACRVRRERTNTPLQALLLMNDPQYVEAARHLAQRILTEGGRTDRRRAAWALCLATCREATDDDLADILGLLAAQRAEFRANPKRAKSLIAFGESAPEASLDPVEFAAWTMVANLILNLDEVITKG